LILGATAWTIYWCKFKDGKKKMAEKLQKRQRKADALLSLPDDLDMLKRKVQILMDLVGAPNNDDDEDVDIEKQALLAEEEPTESAIDKEDDSENGDDIPAEFLEVTV
jgi:hypothetical protein